MRKLSFNGYKCDKKFLIAFAITLICSIICGIVLFKIATVNIFFRDFAEDYVYYVFNFKNSSLIFPHLLSEILYLYLFFLLGYFTRLKYVTLALVFVRGLFFAVYAAILIGLNALGGVMVAVLVFIPTALASLALCCLTAEICRIINKKIVFFMPLVFALVNVVLMILLINIVFRVVIVIV